MSFLDRIFREGAVNKYIAIYIDDILLLALFMIIIIPTITITTTTTNTIIITRWGWCQWTSIYGSDGPSQVR